MSSRKHLLIVRVGDRSLHPNWLTQIDDASRKWDLHLSYYGDKDDPYPDRPRDVTLTREKGAKFPGLAVCLEKLGSRVDDYDYVGLPDDDLYCRGQTWNRFFEIVEQYKPLVAQPALKTGSFFSIDGVMQRSAYLLRWTSFVEVMTPVFSREALPIARNHFTENQSGWGMDYLWPKLFKAEEHTMCVVDATPVLHTRAVGVGPLYAILNNSPQGPWAEMGAFLARHGLERKPFETFAGVTRNGKTITFPSPLQRPSRVAWHLQKLWLRLKVHEFKAYQMQILAG